MYRYPTCLPVAGCMKIWLKLINDQLKFKPISTTYFTPNYALFNYKIVVKKGMKSFIQPAPGDMKKHGKLLAPVLK